MFVPSQRRAAVILSLALTLLLTGLLPLRSPTLFSVLSSGGPSTARAADAGAEEPDSGSGPQDKGPLARAKSLIDSREEDEAIELLTNYIATTSHPQSLAHAYLLMAAALSDKKEYAEAIEYLERLLSEFPGSELGVRARLLLGAVRAQAGDQDAALSSLSEARTLAADSDQKREALKLTGEVYANKKDFLHAIKAWLEELTLSPEEQRSELRTRIHSLVQDKMDKKALLQVRDAYPTAFPGDVALIRLIEFHTNRGEEHLAERNLRLFLERFPAHEYAQSASEQLHAFKAKVKASQYVIAALLPTSGRMSAFGTESLNGIRLALEKGKETLGLTSVGLMVKDSHAADKAALRAELSELVAEYRPLAVIGPMFSRELQAVAGIAEATEIPFITPSAPVTDVRRLGTYLFSTALTSSQQVRRLADYAMGRLGHRRFCVLYPDNAYGQELTRLFVQEVRQRGGEMIAVESYAESETDFGQQIKRLKTEDLKHHGTATTTPTSKGGTRITYTPGFDAVFLPSSYAQAALIAPQLLFYDVKVLLLGSNAWHSPDLLRMGERWMEGSVFADGLLPDSQDPVVRDFVERYRRRFQTNPSLFSAQAYDATRLVLEAIRKGANSGRGVRDQFLKLQDLPSLGGPASFGPGGTLDRRVFLIQVKHGKFVALE